MSIIIPKHWKEIKINELTKIVAGGTPSTTNADYFDGDIPWISPVDLSGYRDKYISKGRRNISELGLKNSSAKLLPKNTVLFSSRAPIGYVAIAKNELCTNQGFKNLLPNEYYDASYAYYYLKQIKDLVESVASGTTFKEISGNKMGEIPFLLAPLQEQKRIANKLDLLFQSVDSLNERIDKIPVILKQFRERVLELAITGELTREWRKKRKDAPFFEFPTHDEMREVNIILPDNWQWQPFSTAASIKSNLVEPNKYLNYPLIAPDNIESGKGILISKPLVSDIMPISAKHLFNKNCIIYSKIRPNLSKLVIVDFNGLCSADMYPIIPKLELKYMYYYMLSGIFLSYATTAGERSVLPKINQKGLSTIPVSIPPLLEQQEIVKKVDELFSIAEKIEQSFKDLKQRIENLPTGILKRAFRGDLVEQDKNDEPVTQLLERIKRVNLHSEENLRSAASTNVANYRSTHSIKSKVNNSNPNNFIMNLTEIIKEHFGKDSFTFEQLNEHLKHDSKEQYIKTKKYFFKLLRNEKLKKKESKIISEVDKSLGVIKYKLFSDEALTV